MSIQLVTYANQTVTPTNDAIIYEKAIDQNGIFYGCNVTITSNNVNITGGYGIVCGREFVIQSESIAVTLAPSGTLDGRLYVRLDLADADDPIQLLTATGNTLPALEQDSNVNYTNGAYEMELATFTVGVSALSDVAETFETITGSKQDEDYTSQVTGVGNFWSGPRYSLEKYGNHLFFRFWGYIALADYAANTLYTLCTIPLNTRPNVDTPLNGKMTDASYNYKGGVAGAVKTDGSIVFSIETHTTNYFSIVAEWSV